MTPTNTYILRKCCPFGPGSAQPVAELAEPPAGTEPSAWTGSEVGRIEAPEPKRWMRECVHEAAHAVMGIGLGARVLQAQVDGAPLIRFDGLSKLPWASRVAINEAGDIAQRMRFAWPERPDDDELHEHAEAIRTFSFGACDRCQSFSQIVRENGLQAPDDKHLACYRSIERETILILERNDVWSAVLELADMLWDNGVIQGNVVHEIVECHVQSGSIQIGNGDIDAGA